jgi:hypothetical protein
VFGKKIHASLEEDLNFIQPINSGLGGLIVMGPLLHLHYNSIVLSACHLSYVLLLDWFPSNWIRSDMKMNEQLIEFLRKDINKNIKTAERRRNRHENKSTVLKLSAYIGSGIVTILLGLKSFQNNLLADITLLLSVLINLLNGIEGFYNHRGLWVKDVKTLESLRELKRDFEFYVASENKDGLTIEKLAGFKDRLQNICNDDIKTWSKIKEEQILFDEQKRSKGNFF